MPVLTGLDVVGIQSFVFGSSRLRDVVGASWLVDWVTALSDGATPANGATQQSGGALNEVGLKSDQVLLAAGGNAVLRFGSLDEARKFAACYSRLVFAKAPGVEVVIAHRKYEDGELAKALRALQFDLARSKLERRPDVPLLGISVTASCANTGLPAVFVDQRDPSGNRLLSRQAERTGDKSLREQSTARWRTLLPQDRMDWRDFEFPTELDDLGSSSGERSLLGVVHIDGNSIGSRIQAWLKNHADVGTPDEPVEAEYREWSAALKRLGEIALQAVLQRVFGAIEPRRVPGGRDSRWVANPRVGTSEPVGSRSANSGPESFRGAKGDDLTGPDDDGGESGEQRELSFRLRDVTFAKHDGAVHNWWLPIRPILLGGDDLTFLCDGRIALDLAATALRAMEDAASRDESLRHLNTGESPITACAGVAIVPHHAPFVRSYELAEALCQSAKKKAREFKAKQTPIHVSCIDWHVGLPKPGLGVSEVREREYVVARKSEAQSLTCRPYVLDPVSGQEDGLSWQWLDETLLDGTEQGLRASKAWNTRRNKVKELREVLRSSEDADRAVTQALERWQVVGPGIGLPKPIDRDGFLHRKRTPLFDAIELLDLHLPLGLLANAAQQNTKETT